MDASVPAILDNIIEKVDFEDLSINRIDLNVVFLKPEEGEQATAIMFEVDFLKAELLRTQILSNFYTIYSYLGKPDFLAIPSQQNTGFNYVPWNDSYESIGLPSGFRRSMQPDCVLYKKDETLFWRIKVSIQFLSMNWENIP